MIKFNVFKGKDDQHYAHMRASNGRITWQSEGYTRVAGAHKVCASTWAAISKAIDPKRAVSLVPYARGSLLPRLLS